MSRVPSAACSVVFLTVVVCGAFSIHRDLVPEGGIRERAGLKWKGRKIEGGKGR